MTVRENKSEKRENIMDKLWLFVPERPVNAIYIFAEHLQNKASDLMKLIEDKKTAAVDSLYNEFHEGSDV